MAFTIKLKDDHIDLKIKTDLELSASSTVFANLLHAIVVLNETIDMVSYNGTRVGTTDVWEFTATTALARNYTATTSDVAGSIEYSNVALDQGTPREVRAFLNVMDQLANNVLTPMQLKTIEVTWS